MSHTGVALSTYGKATAISWLFRDVVQSGVVLEYLNRGGLTSTEIGLSTSKIGVAKKPLSLSAHHGFWGFKPVFTHLD